MLVPRVMPALLLRNGGLVKSVRFKNHAYVGDPINAIRIYNEKEVDELVFLDITATTEGRRPPFDLLREIASECFMPVTYGGGIRTLADIQELFHLGIEKAAINSTILHDPAFVSQAARVFGSQAVVVSIDVRKTLLGKYEVFAHSVRKGTKLDPVDFARRMEELGAGELLVTSVDRDGTWEGFDLELLRRVTSAVGIPVIACGGAGTVEDVGKAVREGGASAVAAGSMVVYQGKGLGVLIKFPTRKELASVLQ